MEIALVVLGFIIFGPITVALVALTKVRDLGRRVENCERFMEVRAVRTAPREVPQRETAPLATVAPAPSAVAVAERLPLQPLRPRILQPVAVAAPPPPPMPIEPVVARPKPDRQAPVKEAMPLENVIGERVLPRVGVVAIVLGLALLVWYAWGRFGPEGKIALTASTGAAMVIGGAILRRNSLTLVLGNCLVGGGWAVLYITAYAAHSIPASRVITSPALGFIVLLAVAEAALFHAWRYRSESVAGLAYLLTIATLLISPAPLGAVAGWSAIGLSGAILLALSLKEKWIRLCLFGATLLYVAEAVWLSRTVNQPESILLALGVLSLLWLMWTLPSYFLKPKTDVEKLLHGLLVAINSVGLLVSAALIHRWFHLQHMGWVWITLGALNALSAFIGRNAAWRPAHVTHLAIAAIFIGVGAREQFTALGPVAAWLGIAVSLFAWGLGRRDAIPRFMGLAALAITGVTFWNVDWLLDHAAAPGLVIPGLLFGAAIILSRGRDAHPLERNLVQPLIHAAAVALGLAIWKYSPNLTGGAFFTIAGLVFLLIARRSKVPALAIQGFVFLTIPIAFLATETLTATGDVAGISRRIASTVPVLVGWFLARRGSEKGREAFGAMLFGGVLALLACEVSPVHLPVAWGLACGAWYLWSRLEDQDFEFVLAAVGSLVTTAIYALTPELRVPGLGWTGPVASGALLSAIFVAIHLTSLRKNAGEVQQVTRDIFAGVIAIILFTLLGREFSGTELTAAWAALGFALAAYGSLARDRVGRWSGLLVLFAALGHAAILDQSRASVCWALVAGAWFLQSRWVKRETEFIFAAVAAMGAVLLFASAPMLEVPALGWAGPVGSGVILSAIFLAIHLASRDLRPALVRDAIAAALAVTGFILLAREMTGTWLTGSWAILGFALAAYGFLVRDRVSRWSSLLVLGVCVGKVTIFDLARFELPVKIATLITLGTVMVALSYVYARNHRRIAVYLAAKE